MLFIKDFFSLYIICGNVLNLSKIKTGYDTSHKQMNNAIIFL
jgi:hypothetical protein